MSTGYFPMKKAMTLSALARVLAESFFIRYAPKLTPSLFTV